MRRGFFGGLAGVLVGLLAGCSTGSSGGGAPTYRVGGSVSGIPAGESLTLLLNGGNALTLTADGSFFFARRLKEGASYAVSIGSEPPSAICTLTAASGTIAKNDVTDVAASCVPGYTVGGSLSGLPAGEAMTLRNNGADPLTLDADGPFTFPTKVIDGGAFAVTVGAQPTTATCVVTMASGLVAGAPVTSVTATCTPNLYSIGGTLSGLPAGDALILRNNGGDDLPLFANGSFTFATRLTSGSSYEVTVFSQPPNATCTITLGSGTVGAANVTSVQASCAPVLYTVGGTLSGLPAGETVTLQLNGGQDLPLAADGPFSFGTGLPSGSAYTVTVAVQPASASCILGAASGTIAGANVSDVTAFCAVPPPFDLLALDDAVPTRLHRLDPQTGTATALSHGGIPGTRIEATAFNPNFGILWGIGNDGLGGSRLYRIDRATGTAIDQGALSGPSDIKAAGFNPNNNTLWGWSAATGELVTIDVGTRVVSVVGNPGAGADIQAMAWDPALNRLYAFDNASSSLVRLNPLNATPNFVMSLAEDLDGLAWEPIAEALLASTQSGKLLGIDPDVAGVIEIDDLGYARVDALAYDTLTGTVYGAVASGLGGAASTLVRCTTTANPAGGVATSIGSTGFAALRGLAWDPAGGVMYAVDGQADLLTRIDPASGACTPVGPLGAAAAATALAWEPGGALLYAVDDAVPGGIYTVDPATGAATPVATVAQTGFAAHGLAIDPAGGQLYLVGSPDTGDDQLLAAPLAGPLTTAVVGTVSGYVGLRGLLWDAGASLLYAAATAPQQLLGIDPGSAAATAAGLAAAVYEALEIEP